MDTAPARKALDRRLAPLRPADAWSVPSRGWARAIRDALGMTTAQLGRRLGMTQSNVVRLEQAEARQAITLQSLDRLARALDCTLVYALVPNRPLEQTVRDRAAVIAARHQRAAGHSMRLEDQGIDRAEEDAQTEALVRNLLAGTPSRLWDEPDA